MDTKTKYRIIGIAVLVLALAVIVVPLFFGRSEKVPRLSAHVPNPPTDKMQTQQTQLTIPADAVQAAHPDMSHNDLATAAMQAPRAPAPAPTTTLNSPPASLNAANATPNSATTAATAISQQAAAETSPAATSQPINATESDDLASPPMTEPAASSSSSMEEAKRLAPENRNKTGKVKTKYATREHHAEKVLTKYRHHPTEQLKKAKLAQAWTVQLGSFNQKVNAEMLIKRLRAKGFPAYLHQAKTDKVLVRVFVGPELRREKAEELVKRLHSEFGMKGLVVKYKV